MQPKRFSFKLENIIIGSYYGDPILSICLKIMLKKFSLNFFYF